MTQAKSCYLYSDDPSLKTVHLPDSAAVFIGRSPDTNIVDTKCSRQQVRLYANYVERTVLVQQIGPRPSGLNGFKTRKEVKFVARHGDRLEVLYGSYPYRIEFNPPLVQSNNQISKKRAYEPEIYEDDDRESFKMFKSEDSFQASPDDEIDALEKSETARSSPPVPKEKKGPETAVTAIGSNSNIDGSWETVVNGELMVYTLPGAEGRSRIAAYDLDGTLITTKTGYKFPQFWDDWRFLCPDPTGKMKKLHTDGYKIVIFTNQGAIGKGKVAAENFKRKIRSILPALGVPIQVFVAIGSGRYRKPMIGMWEILEGKMNGGVSIDRANSLYVGDAAGRPNAWAPGKKKDHSSVDRLFALNLGVPFQTPEEHFLGYKPGRFDMPAFDPRSLPQNGDVCDPSTRIVSDNQEVILMVGSPGSGKSHFVRHYLKEYARVNRDTLGSWQKCVSSIEKLLDDGERVVVDNTNPDRASRRRYIEVAKQRNVPIRCFVMSVTIDQARHNNRFRELTDRTHVKVGEPIIRSYAKSYVPPTVEEGFNEIVEIKFVPKFESDEHRTLYTMYLLER